MPTREEIVSKVRKLLAKTSENGCTPAEADAAFAMASRVMAEHAIDMEEVATSANSTYVEEYCEEAIGEAANRWSSERSWAASLVGGFFFVNTYVRRYQNPTRTRQFFFGTPTNIETAKWVYLALLDSFQLLWSQARKEHGFPPSDRRNFILGVIHGYRQKLQDEREALSIEREIMGKTGSEIVLASADQKRQEALRIFIPKMGASTKWSTPKGSMGALQAGKMAGRRLNLHRPLGSGEGADGKRKALGDEAGRHAVEE